MSWSVARAVGSSNWRSRWRTLVAAGVLAGLVGGVTVAAFAGARRTSTAYDRLVDATDFPDAFVQLVDPAPGAVDDILVSPSVERAVPSLFAVGRLGGQLEQNLVPVQAGEEPPFDQLVLDGRIADPSAADEITVSESMAAIFDLEVGDVLAHQALSENEFGDLLDDTWDGSATGPELGLRVVGITRSPTDALLDEFPTITGTAAYLARFGPSETASQALWVHLRPGATVDELAADVDAASARGGIPPNVVDFDGARSRVDDAATVVVSGLLAGGAITLLAGSVLVFQMAARQAEHTRADRRVMRELGATRGQRLAATALTGTASATVAFVVTAVVATVLSHWMPAGVARSLEPSTGIDGNVVYLLIGPVVVALLVIGAAALAVTRSDRVHPRPAPSPGRWLPGPVGGPVRSVAFQLAFGARLSGRGRGMAFGGVVAALSGVVAVGLFTMSLNDLVTEPQRWGWTGDHQVNLPQPVYARTGAVLDDASEVAAWAEIRGGVVDVRGRLVDGYTFEVRRGDLEPVVIEGRAPVGSTEVGLGPALLDDLELDIGDRVPVDGTDRTVVGSVFTFANSDRSTVTGGALLGGAGGLNDEYSSAMVRYVDGVDPEVAASALYGDLEYGVPGRPVTLTNLAALEPLLRLLLGVLSVTGLAALVHVALSTANRARRDLAVLRALGLTRRHARCVVLVATVLVAAVASVVGALAGLVAGRVVWTAVVATTDFVAYVRVQTVFVVVVLVAFALVVVLGGLGAGRRAVSRPSGAVLLTE